MCTQGFEITVTCAELNKGSSLELKYSIYHLSKDAHMHCIQTVLIDKCCCNDELKQHKGFLI